MRIAGIVFILGSTGYMGLQLGHCVHAHRRQLSQLLSALQIMKNEIAFCGTPIPQLFSLLGEHMTGELGKLFSDAGAFMQNNQRYRVSEAFEQISAGRHCRWLLPLLYSLTDKLGEYDLEAQLGGIEATKSLVVQQMELLDTEGRQRGKAYEALAVCAGLALAILLI